MSDALSRSHTATGTQYVCIQTKKKDRCGVEEETEENKINNEDIELLQPHSLLLNASSLSYLPPFSPSFSLSPSLSSSLSPSLSLSPSHSLFLPFFLLGGKIIMRSEIGNPGGTKSAVRTCLSVCPYHTTYIAYMVEFGSIWYLTPLFNYSMHSAPPSCPLLLSSRSHFIATFLYSCSFQVGGSLLSSAPLSNTLNVSTASSGKEVPLYFPSFTLHHYLHPLFSIW